MLNINTILKEKGFTKKSLADEIGISREFLYSILNGNPTVKSLESVAAALDISVWQLFAGSEDALNGFVEYNHIIHRIQSIDDMKKIIKKIELAEKV